MISMITYWKWHIWHKGIFHSVLNGTKHVFVKTEEEGEPQGASEGLTEPHIASESLKMRKKRLGDAEVALEDRRNASEDSCMDGQTNGNSPMYPLTVFASRLEFKKVLC